MGAMQKLKNLFVGEDELEQEDAMYQQPVYENKTDQRTQVHMSITHVR